nr:hypothetical protein [Tanacetum cinerariifolium]
MAAEPRWLSAVGGNNVAAVMMRAGWWWHGLMVGMMEVRGVELWWRWCRGMKPRWGSRLRGNGEGDDGVLGGDDDDGAKSVVNGVAAVGWWLVGIWPE